MRKDVISAEDRIGFYKNADRSVMPEKNDSRLIHY